jgi:hypothetical protein
MAVKIFYVDGKPIQREKDLQILYNLVWYGTSSDASPESNSGRGPVDFKISRGAADKTLVSLKEELTFKKMIGSERKCLLSEYPEILFVGLFHLVRV